MSNLFDKKQDVLDFQLTPLGRKKLRQGTFKPYYYAFGDADITYDTRFFGISGSQNQTVEDLDVKDRPKVSTYPTLTSDKIFRKEFFYPSILGNSEIGSNLYPAFELKLYNGTISGTISYLTSTYLNQNIPTINVIMKCKYDKTNNNFLSHEYLLLELNELNGLYEKDNFDVSIVRRKETMNRVINRPMTIEQDLQFSSKDYNSIYHVNPLLIDEDAEYKEDEVEYWFNLETDENISDQIEFANNNQSNIYLRPENNSDSRNC